MTDCLFPLSTISALVAKKTVTLTYGMLCTKLPSLGQILQHWREEVSGKTILNKVNHGL